MYQALNGKGHGGYLWERNKLTLDLGVARAKGIADTNGDGRLDSVERAVGMVESGKQYAGELRYDRFIGERNSLYLLGGALVDPFAGYDLRTHEQLGWSRLLVHKPDTSLKAELGFDYAQENYVEGVDPNSANIYAARVLVGFTHNFNESVGISDTVEVYSNVVDLDDVRVLNTAALTAKLSNILSLKLSHTLAYDNVPVDGFESLDHTTMATVVASIL